MDPNDAIELNDLNLPPSATGFNLNVEIANDTSNQVSISDIRIPILSVEGLESLNMIEGPNLLATSADLDEVEARVAFDDKNIYLFPGREVNLSRKQKRMLSLYSFFDHDDIDLNLEFGPIEMNTNSVNYKVLDSGEVLTWSGGSVGQTTDSESKTDSDSSENSGSTTPEEVMLMVMEMVCLLLEMILLLIQNLTPIQTRMKTLVQLLRERVSMMVMVMVCRLLETKLLLILILTLMKMRVKLIRMVKNKVTSKDNRA